MRIPSTVMEAGKAAEFGYAPCIFSPKKNLAILHWWHTHQLQGTEQIGILFHQLQETDRTLMPGLGQHWAIRETTVTWPFLEEKY
jgi:hypothetical protein